VRTNRGFLEGAGPDIVEALGGENVEMVEPEGGHHLLQLARALDCAGQACLDRFAHHDPGANPLVLDSGFECCRVCVPVFPTGLNDRELKFAK